MFEMVVMVIKSDTLPRPCRLLLVVVVTSSTCVHVTPLLEHHVIGLTQTVCYTCKAGNMLQFATLLPDNSITQTQT